jgi:hypothetical protein
MEAVNNRIAAVQGEIHSARNNIDTLSGYRKEVINLIQATENYHRQKALVDKQETPQNKKAFQEARQKLMDMKQKSLPDISALRQEVAELDKAIPVFVKQAAIQERELQKTQKVKSNLSAMKNGHDTNKEQPQNTYKSYMNNEH